MIARHGGGVDQGLIATLAYVHNQMRVSTYGEQVVASIVDRGFWSKRRRNPALRGIGMA